VFGRRERNKVDGNKKREIEWIVEVFGLRKIKKK